MEVKTHLMHVILAVRKCRWKVLTNIVKEYLTFVEMC